MAIVSNFEWLNQNSLRAYPIRENLTRQPVDANGAVLTGVTLPNYLIVDLVLAVPGSTLVRAYLSQLTKAGQYLTFVITDDAGVQITGVVFDYTAHTTNQFYALAGVGSYADVRGTITIGDITNLDTDLADGVYSFPLTATEFETRTVRPDIRGVRSLQLVDQGVVSESIYGEVLLNAGANIRLRYLPASNAIEISAIAGEGLNDECDCAEAVGKDNIVRRINGFAVADASLIAGDCMSVVPSGNKITLSDTCAKPCCSCPELEALTTALVALESTITTLDSFATQLNDRITTFVTNYILATTR